MPQCRTLQLFCADIFDDAVCQKVLKCCAFLLKKIIINKWTDFLGHHVYRRSVSESVMSQEHCGGKKS